MVNISKKFDEQFSQHCWNLNPSGIMLDLVAHNSMINVFGKAKLFREAHLLIKVM
jgi:pentatricopeptide repeat protein